MRGPAAAAAQLDLTGKTDVAHLLEILQAWHGEWVPQLYRVSGVMVHSRIADLRRRGHQIECKRFGQGDYRYRLVSQVKEET